MFPSSQHVIAEFAYNFHLYFLLPLPETETRASSVIRQPAPGPDGV